MLPSLYFFYSSCKTIYQEVIAESGISLHLLFNSAFDIAFTVVFGVLAYFAIKRWFNKDLGLTLNREGIIDNSGIVPSGTILWSEVEEINTSKIMFSDCVNVKVHHPQKFILRERNLFNRVWMWMENRRSGSPVNISSSGLQIKFKELFSIMQHHYLSSQVETRTLDLRREKDEILQEKTELLDSINYAKRIQTALLPSHALIEQKLGESFILFPEGYCVGRFLLGGNSERVDVFCGVRLHGAWSSRRVDQHCLQ